MQSESTSAGVQSQGPFYDIKNQVAGRLLSAPGSSLWNEVTVEKGGKEGLLFTEFFLTLRIKGGKLERLWPRNPDYRASSLGWLALRHPRNLQNSTLSQWKNAQGTHKEHWTPCLFDQQLIQLGKIPNHSHFFPMPWNASLDLPRAENLPNYDLQSLILKIKTTSSPDQLKSEENRTPKMTGKGVRHWNFPQEKS